MLYDPPLWNHTPPCPEAQPGGGVQGSGMISTDNLRIASIWKHTALSVVRTQAGNIKKEGLKSEAINCSIDYY